MVCVLSFESTESQAKCKYVHFHSYMCLTSMDFPPNWCENYICGWGGRFEINSFILLWRWLCICLVCVYKHGPVCRYGDMLLELKQSVCQVYTEGLQVYTALKRSQPSIWKAGSGMWPLSQVSIRQSTTQFLISWEASVEAGPSCPWSGHWTGTRTGSVISQH